MDDFEWPKECPHCGHIAEGSDFECEGEHAEAAGVLQCPQCHELIWGDE